MAKQLSVNNYVEFINSAFEKAKYPKIGHIYAFGYLFNQNPNFDREKIKEIKFFDFYPCAFVFDINVKEHYFTGFNIHAIPPEARDRWVELISHYVEDNAQDPRKFLILKRLFQGASKYMRKYYMRRVKSFREIPVHKWYQMLDYYANTTYGATMAEISAKYLSLIE